jgi:hypothetical protein
MWDESREWGQGLEIVRREGERHRGSVNLGGVEVEADGDARLLHSILGAAAGRVHLPGVGAL